MVASIASKQAAAAAAAAAAGIAHRDTSSSRGTHRDPGIPPLLLLGWKPTGIPDTSSRGRVKFTVLCYLLLTLLSAVGCPQGQQQSSGDPSVGIPLGSQQQDPAGMIPGGLNLPLQASAAAAG